MSLWECILTILFITIAVKDNFQFPLLLLIRSISMSSNGVYLTIGSIQPTCIQYRNWPIIIVTICECKDTMYTICYGVWNDTAREYTVVPYSWSCDMLAYSWQWSICNFFQMYDHLHNLHTPVIQYLDHHIFHTTNCIPGTIFRYTVRCLVEEQCQWL